LLTEFLFQPLLFVMAVVLLYYIPGTVLQQAAGWNLKDGLIETALRTGIGLVAVPVLYEKMRRFGITDSLMLAAVILVAAYWIYRVKRFRPRPWNADDWVSLIVAILFVGILLSFSHFADFRLAEGGSLYRTTPLSESTFHQGLINSLKDSFPPPALYAAGSADFSSYHLNMHLQIEGMNRLTGIGTDRLVFWYFPLLYFLLLFLLPVAFVRSHGGAAVPAIVAGMLVFGTGLSFLPGLAGLEEPSFAWVQFFHADIMGLFTLNGLIPSLIALFVVLLVFATRGEAQRSWHWWVLGLMMIGAYGFKSSMGAQMAGACLATGVICYLADDERAQSWRMAACGAISLLLMLLDQAYTKSGIGENFGENFIEFRPWYPLDYMLRQFGMTEILNIFKPVWFLIFLLLGLGVRVLGLITLKASIRRHPENIRLVLFILTIFLSGYVLADFLYLGDSSYQFNHATWFAIQGMFAAWFLLFLFMARLDAHKPTHALLLISLLALSLPSTVQLLWRKSDSGVAYIGPEEQEIVAYLEGTDPASVVMHPLNQDWPSLASNLAGRSSVLNIHKSFVNESQGLERRAYALLMFFGAETDGLTRLAIMNYYGVTHVYAPRQFDEILGDTPDLTLVFRNSRHSVWKVAL
jgi:hypothetical protein